MPRKPAKPTLPPKLLFKAAPKKVKAKRKAKR